MGIRSTKKLSKNVNEMMVLQNKIDELTKLNKVLENKLEKKTKQHSILSGKNKEELSSKHTFKMRLELKEKEVDKLKKEQMDLMKVCDELKQRIKDLKHSMEINENNTINLEIKLKSAQNKLEYLTKDNTSSMDKYDDLKKVNAKN